MQKERIYGVNGTDRPYRGGEGDHPASEAMIAHSLTRDEAEALRKKLTEQNPKGCYFITVSALRFR